MNKKWLVVLLIGGFLLGNKIIQTYSLFESDTNISADSKIAKWVVYINGEDVVKKQNFVIDNLNITNNENVLEGKLAPGTEAYFDVFINCYQTEVAVRYDISLDFSLIDNSSLVIKGIEEANGKTLIKTGDNTYTGLISREEIKKGKIDDIRVSFKWDNVETNNNKDYIIGSGNNLDVQIPITVSVSQYLGEEIEKVV